MKKVSPRMWCTLILIGLVGQFAWTIENMYFNVFLYNTISTDPGYISAMVGWSAAAATLTTLLMGALSDRVGKRKFFICGGYILWGLSTAAFGFITVENAAKLFPAAQAAAEEVTLPDAVATARLLMAQGTPPAAAAKQAAKGTPFSKGDIYKELIAAKDEDDREEESE